MQQKSSLLATNQIMKAFAQTGRTPLSTISTSRKSSCARNSSKYIGPGGARRQCLQGGPSPMTQTAAGKDQHPQTGPAFLSAMLQLRHHRNQNKRAAEAHQQQKAEHHLLQFANRQHQKELRQFHLYAQQCAPNLNSQSDVPQMFSLPLVSARNRPLKKM